MGRPIQIEGIWIHANTTFCANQCRYCYVGAKQELANISFLRFAAIVERFIEWGKRCTFKEFSIEPWLGYAYNYSIATLIGLRKLDELMAREPTDLIQLGGIIHRPDDEIRLWLEERREIGIEKVVASFAGYDEFHDRWNGRSGNFDFLMRVQTIAAELGMKLVQRIFLTQSTLPLLDGLLRRLDTLSGMAERVVFPLFYCGYASRMEDERITEKQLRSLPEEVHGILRSDWGSWRSEREWIEVVQGEDEVSEKVSLRLVLKNDNIQRIETMSCDEIVAELEEATRTAYAAIPTRLELCKACGDTSNSRLYMFRWDVERKWLDSYLKSHPLQFDRHLTHLENNP